MMTLVAEHGLLRAPLESVLVTVEKLLPGSCAQVLEALPGWEEVPFSMVRLICSQEGTRRFLKLAPSVLGEGIRTKILHSLAPNSVPRTLAAGHEGDWEWFVLEDVGHTQLKGSLTITNAMQACSVLGRIERAAEHSNAKKLHVVDCSLSVLNATLIDTIEKGSRVWPAALESWALLKKAASRVDLLVPAEVAELLPDTCVPGDFWSGNIAQSIDEPRIIDWTWATWGMGGTAIVDLIGQHAELAADSHRLWNAYFEGRGYRISSTWVRACIQMAPLISLIRHVTVCSLTGPQDGFPVWLKPALEQLTDSCTEK